ncbi:hypothetical protein [Brevundimonas sp.]|uniref:hypothetical protein n=1 Tax=Brevundimonas sp. TaxID=1871086 RepID=UPI002ED7D425
MSSVTGILSFDLSDTNLEQSPGEPISLFSSGRVEIEGQESWAEVRIVRHAHDQGSHLTAQPGGWRGVVVVGEEWFAILQNAFMTPQTFLLNIAFSGETGAADAPLALKDIALTLMRSAATTEESAA